MPVSYRIDILPSAKRELASLPQFVRRHAASTIGALSDNPRPRGSRKLAVSESDYRIRVGAYRVLYEVRDADRLVVVYRIRHRSRAYH